MSINMIALFLEDGLKNPWGSVKLAFQACSSSNFQRFFALVLFSPEATALSRASVMSLFLLKIFFAPLFLNWKLVPSDIFSTFRHPIFVVKSNPFPFKTESKVAWSTYKVPFTTLSGFILTISTSIPCVVKFFTCR